VNVVGQLVAKEGEGDSARLSLSSNTDITLDLLPELQKRRTEGKNIAAVAQINPALPFMEGEAAVPVSTFDHILEGPEFEFSLFAPPKEQVSLADYAAAIHTAVLIKDGGTIQLGIGAFSDALAHVLYLRQKHNERFRDLV